MIYSSYNDDVYSKENKDSVKRLFVNIKDDEVEAKLRNWNEVQFHQAIEMYGEVENVIAIADICWFGRRAHTCIAYKTLANAFRADRDAYYKKFYQGKDTLEGMFSNDEGEQYFKYFTMKPNVDLSDFREWINSVGVKTLWEKSPEELSAYLEPIILED